ncbi:MAG: SPOR domain-containing protein [Deltaproteobacteria bacterium]|nr:SPOR domain-containing protein [Deltaproteobacteria bacterium]
MDEKVQEGKLEPGIPVPPGQDDLRQNVGKLVDRLLSRETTFFDHYRLRSLGGQLDPAPSPDKPTNSEMYKAFSKVFKAVPLPPARHQGIVTDGARAPTAKAQAQAAQSAPTPKDREQSSQEAKPDGLGKDGHGEAEEGQDQTKGTEGRKLPPRGDPGWLSPVKWLTRLLFSFLVLAWIFILGFIVGRATLDPDATPISPISPISTNEATAISPISANEALADGAPALDDELEPISEAYPVVIVSPGPGQRASNSGYWAAFAENSPATPTHVAEEARMAGTAIGAGRTEAQATPAADQRPPSPGREGQAEAGPPARIDSLAVTTPMAAETAPKPAPDDEGFWPAKPDKPGSYTIQVGSASTEEEARAMVARFAAKGFDDAYCYRTRTGRFNVRVGRYSTESEGRVAAVALAAAGAVKPYVSKLNL